MTEAIDRATTARAVTVLSIGQQVDLSLALESRVFTAAGRIDDWDDNRCCVATLMSGITIGTGLQVTARRADGLYRFAMQVADLRVNPPGFWLVCSGPYQRIQRRRYVRLGGLHVSVQTWRSGQRIAGVTLGDISGGGLGIQSKTPLRVGDVLRLEFSLPERKLFLLRVMGIVQRVGADGTYGVQFRGVPYVTSEGIVSWVFSQLSRRLSRP
ncbi:MAG: PilZ domain-containing protein [Chloroflexota bacterium]|nr:MAG: PilZ domain-containing protein [Chloroflexota bacterium]